MTAQASDPPTPTPRDPPIAIERAQILHETRAMAREMRGLAESLGPLQALPDIARSHSQPCVKLEVVEERVSTLHERSAEHERRIRAVEDTLVGLTTKISTSLAVGGTLLALFLGFITFFAQFAAKYWLK